MMERALIRDNTQTTKLRILKGNWYEENVRAEGKLQQFIERRLKLSDTTMNKTLDVPLDHANQGDACIQSATHTVPTQQLKWAKIQSGRIKSNYQGDSQAFIPTHNPKLDMSKPIRECSNAFLSTTNEDKVASQPIQPIPSTKKAATIVTFPINVNLHGASKHFLPASMYIEIPTISVDNALRFGDRVQLCMDGLPVSFDMWTTTFVPRYLPGSSQFGVEEYEVFVPQHNKESLSSSSKPTIPLARSVFEIVRQCVSRSHKMIAWEAQQTLISYGSPISIRNASTNRLLCINTVSRTFLFGKANAVATALPVAKKSKDFEWTIVRV
ncbi:hypothetical protein BATDEDRAFT_26353 [Batrachochytrium dendrobatidis JAM81]|uniref:Uncharacterized protein n=1 Tax=Batrachochytrium dendrobatidis (strain JAM81 / FGSC 10211) TaxID=684364 RepID=F4P6Z0_BATDJ|nr:uncharacterized protein BATDEDRAFT_26353 [Batrachochytrium dendrobatidis JAM81]EGF78930.1 hypothetical protein BATDEDRAFT_26353 [Batrachochytrium dendrobatidis JAM81]|eukprot:XP_006680365.1 hypothetical protein BATDEDRAFT_26353 [Batrachochytrium dendrobatidis JAM81]